MLVGYSRLDGFLIYKVGLEYYKVNLDNVKIKLKVN